jgi:cobalamin 5'-phosphate synthase/cobalamin synthase
VRLLAAAIAFLTRLPVARGTAFDAKTVARAARWFPLVGALLGAIYAGALRLASPVFPAAVTAVMLAALDAALTGAMHLDGLADSADGFGGGRTREDVLRIMRDHAIGAYGAVALAVALALRVAAVAALIGRGAALPAVFLAPVLGRWAAVLLGATLPYARPPEQDATGAPARSMGKAELAIATGTAALAAGACGWRGGGAALLAGAAALVWGWRSARRIGGVTGDTLGAAVVMTECLVLILFSAAV